MENKENKISKEIIGAAIEVHRTLGGPGLLESVYEEALIWELKKKFDVKSQIELPVIYKRHKLNQKFRLDILINDLVIIECKATSKYNNIFESQLLTYLRLSGKKLGLLINFGEKRVIDGIHRVVNDL